MLFQSTPSAWRETETCPTCRPLWCNFNPLPPHGGRLAETSRLRQRTQHFNPLPPHGGRQGNSADYFGIMEISIHSLRMEGDFQPLNPGCRATAFQSTPSAWRETFMRRSFEKGYDISIHSLRMEGDCQWKSFRRTCRKFQSTPSAWRETCYQSFLTY